VSSICRNGKRNPFGGGVRLLTDRAESVWIYALRTLEAIRGGLVGVMVS
jgi:hypothetical protein